MQFLIDKMSVLNFTSTKLLNIFNDKEKYEEAIDTIDENKEQYNA